MLEKRLRELEKSGWRLTRDGSTATAYLAWDDADDPESGWEVLVLHTAGHGAKLTVNVSGSGLSERTLAEALRFREAIDAAAQLVRDWSGEVLAESDDSGV